MSDPRDWDDSTAQEQGSDELGDTGDGGSDVNDSQESDYHE